MKQLILSFLGLGTNQGRETGAPLERYYPVYYQLDGHQTANSTPLHDIATLEVYPNAHLVLVGTEDVKKAWFGATNLLDVVLKRDCPARCKYDFVQVPKGEDDGERWGILRKLVEVIKDEQGLEELILDVTHGFRTQPLFAVTCISYIQSERRRKRVPPVTVRILYSAYEAREPKPTDHDRDPKAVAPVWDLTQALQIHEWNAAIDSFMRFGRADDLEQLTRAFQKDLNQQLGAGRENRPPKLRELGKECKDFADALATCRIPALLTEKSGKLAKLIRATKPDVEQHLPLLGHQLDDLAKWAESISAESVISHEGVEAGLNLAQIYLDIERFAEAAIAMRETVCTAFGLGIGKTTQHQKKGFDVERGEVDAYFGRKAQGMETTLTKTAYSLQGLRNDIEHGGMREGPRNAASIRSDLRKTLSELRLHRPDGFANLSNHPIAGWLSVQLDAARALGFGDPVDVPLELVDPTATADEILGCASTIAKRVESEGHRAAFVSGDFTFTYALVSSLRALGIRCFAATTERVSSEHQIDGKTLISKEFAFVAWREYL